MEMLAGVMSLLELSIDDKYFSTSSLQEASGTWEQLVPLLLFLYSLEQ